ncbi:hypothetical protein RD055328_08560 [Companilactobacillus sp. RD055328]|uniref:hypothetical protein n=1 Tax=Companilactobacillus sp. RD055328 TaxID=2916634 RepID=UPI001FC8BE9C|nr:hypothetical protein [Companilactobacillus sp. RD055328]GKQ42933.1 hypothetical protein RD055328_08560 [Companilactobacillus sp. RD055328]
MYAIKNIRTGKWLYGTNFRRIPYWQMTSFEMALTEERLSEIKYQFTRRRCGKNYKIVKVKLSEVRDD